jgi:hypothetical protein
MHLTFALFLFPVLPLSFPVFYACLLLFQCRKEKQKNNEEVDTVHASCLLSLPLLRYPVQEEKLRHHVLHRLEGHGRGLRKIHCLVRELCGSTTSHTTARGTAENADVPVALSRRSM